MPSSQVLDSLQERTDQIRDRLHDDWGTAEQIDPVEYGPKPWYPDDVPDSVTDQLDEFAGVTSVVLFYTDAREEVVVVYNRGGYWEPPGGAIEGEMTPEETARMEAREETGLDAELDDLLYTGEIHYQYDSGAVARLPLATFVGHAVGGTLRPERERTDHPGATRALGVFRPDDLPEGCRDYELIQDLFETGPGTRRDDRGSPPG